MSASSELTAVVASVRTQLSSAYKLSPPKTVEVEQIPSREEGRAIKCHLYQSKEPSPCPVLINFHGGGFIVPLHTSDDEFNQRVARETKYTVLDVTYRLGPEDPFPAAVNDVEDAIKWVLSQSQRFDVTRLTLSGFSAGANLALVAASHLFPQTLFNHVVAFYPATDLATDPENKIAPDPSGQPIPPSMLRLFRSCYIPDGVDPKEPRISPLFTDATMFPDNLYFITCEKDSLCWEGEELAQNIEKVPGKNIVLRRLAQCDHAWDKFCEDGTVQGDAKHETYSSVIAFLRG